MEPQHKVFQNPIGRRQFVTAALTFAGTSALLMAANKSIAGSPAFVTAAPTIQQVIDLILKSVPGAPFPNTVDTIKAGDATQPVKGIVTTMFATIEVIEKAARLGANFIIAHEPTFYNHTDETAWLKEDAVYQRKRALLEKHGIVVWRFHDAIHAHRPDGVLMGVLTALGWQQYYNAEHPLSVTIPKTTLQNIVTLAKDRLGISHVRIVGDLQDVCSRIVLIPGAAGGRMQMQALMKERPDLLMVGEVNEWETSEYVRDLRQTGATTSLLVLGHIVSEEPGLQWLKTWLQPQLPAGITITHIPSTDAFTWV
jgi:putative NIF3 family GTP cyclohydrolase 1 type 2